MIDYYKLKKGDRLVVLVDGLWGMVNRDDVVIVNDASGMAGRCQVALPNGRMAYFEGVHAATYFEVEAAPKPDQGPSPVAEALQTEILELVGRNAKLGADLAALSAAIDDTRRLVRQLDIALCGSKLAAKQASLCDLVAMVQEWRLRHGIDESKPLPMFELEDAA